MKTLSDDSLMPFGKHKGIMMMNVPASYLHWLWTNGKKYETKTCSVAAYIEENLEGLKMEYTDGIWD